MVVSGYCHLLENSLISFNRYIPPSIINICIEYNEYIIQDPCIRFLNSFLSQSDNISDKKLRNGVILLQVLDKIIPGSVRWRYVHRKPKTVIEKIENLNRAINIIHTVSRKEEVICISASDLLANTQLYTTFIEEMMRYNALKFMSGNITDSQIIIWCNQILLKSKLNKYHGLCIFNLSDPILSDCIIYNELLATIKPNDIDRNKIYYGILSVDDDIKDKHRFQRYFNARMAIKTVEKFGVKYFYDEEDLIELDEKAVCLMLCAIMEVYLIYID